MDRRQFLLRSGAAAAALAISPVARSAEIRRGIRIDGLSGLNGFENRDGAARPTPALIDAVRQGKLTALSQTMGEVGNGPDRFLRAVEGITRMDRMIAANPGLLAKVDSAADLRAAHANRRLGMIYNFQDTTALEGDASRVALFKTLGIRQQQLTYNKRNLAGDGCLEPGNGGISDFGRQVIAEVNANRLLLDLSHASQRTIAEGIAASKAPPVITHTGCRDLVDVPRNTFDREMRAVADKGGVVGMYFMPFLRASGQAGREDLLRHLDHARKVVGEDHVSIGTDGPIMGIVIDDAARAGQRAFYEDRARRGIAAPGEAADVMNMVDGYNDIDRMDRMTDDLKARGWTAAQVDKVLGGNLLRLYGDVWGG
jgi:membrane dipeptidase